MKLMLGLWLFLFSFNVSAIEYKILVTGWSYVPNYDYMLKLESPLSNHHFVLDCQSFIHELVLYENERENSDRLFEMYFNPSACYELGSWIISYTDTGGRMCFKVNTETRTMTVDTDNYQFCF